MAILVVCPTVWEYINLSLPGEPVVFEAREVAFALVFRVALPLVLIRRIWLGRPWARYGLAAWCVYVMWCNSQLIARFPRSVAAEEWGNAILVVLLVGTWCLIAALALFSSTITALENYRRDEREFA